MRQYFNNLGYVSDYIQHYMGNYLFFFCPGQLHQKHSDPPYILNPLCTSKMKIDFIALK